MDTPRLFSSRIPSLRNTLSWRNPQFSRLFFPPELARTPHSLAFLPAKPPHSLRIFVFGGSAAEGDPAPAFGFARILQVMLRDRYPTLNVEVINTAITAINSNVVRPSPTKPPSIPAIYG